MPSTPVESYTYDAIYQVTQVVQNGSTTSESYTYDPVGNRLSSLGVSPYSHNVSNQLTSTPNATYTYDNNGNTASKTDATGTTTYTWDYENRLTQVALPGSGGMVSFTYDSLGRRIRKQSTSATTIYAYDGENIIEETDGSGAAIARYATGLSIDEALAMLRGGATHYYSADGLGSVTSLTNAVGAVAASYTYDAFGKLAASTGSLNNPFRYTAREWDSETSLYFYRARYYDATAGRFLSEDPIDFEGGINFYAYVENSPSNFTDPYGLKVYVCCRRLLGDRWWKRPLARATFQRHCYILITPDISDPGAERVRFSLNRPKGKKTGEIGRDVDSDRVGNEKKGCKEAEPSQNCKNSGDYNEESLRNALEELVALQLQGKVNESTCRSCGLNYRRLGPNSNTFVTDMLKQHGFVPPSMGRAWDYNMP